MIPEQAQFLLNPRAVVVLDAAGNLLRVTTGFANLMQLPADELLRTNLTALLSGPEARLLPQLLQQALAGRPVDFTTELPRQRGPLTMLLLPLPGSPEQPAQLYGVVQSTESGGGTQAALERQRHLATVLNATADVVFVLSVEGPDYRFVYVNKAFETTTGLSADKVVGKLVQAIIPEPSLSEVLQHYQLAVTTRHPVSWLEVSEYPNGRKTGEVSVTPVFAADGSCQLVGTVHDLTRQKEAEARLEVSNERFRYVLKATTDALYDWNIAADTLYWGEGFETLFGHHLEQNPTPFSKWGDLVEPTEHDRVVAGLRHTALETTNEFWQQTYRFRRADGSWAFVYDRGYILRDEQGRAFRMIGAMQDVSAQQEAEEQQNLLLKRLEKQNADLQQFTYIVSHNLRAPLANSLGYATLLSKVEKTSGVFEESLKNLHTSLQLLDTVVADVTSILSVRDQQGSMRPEAVAIAKVCQQALHSLQQQLDAYGAQVLCQIPDDFQILGSRAYFHSIFHNLLSNAIKYRSDERPLQVVIKADALPDGHRQLVVRDNGQGFDAGQNDVFQLYRRFHPSMPGRGIGLYLVRAHVESMNGRISVWSEVNTGTQFTLLF
ncbi:PAS domain-containing sensor histidine kinase [Hymenobacter endophyticus]|uniref:histidine kinase n=1 Tax=Hymenobacter endophyticus TaxID=3076335 RepID=A0ABU3TJL8_9BACT|nr:PAS domain-containing sensor histidine kinase [Hymenobacter endophyticus]MDU0371557.1 PAS domain-containing sensor histidine kinase [Hymenobacter endophyticus]